jgi:hypothetical protein
MDQTNFRKFQTTIPTVNALKDQVMAFFCTDEKKQKSRKDIDK